jgi:O-antigen/teichoic acid export membrane protein
VTSPNTLRRDLLSAYLASGSRVLSWVVVTAIVYRRLGATNFAMLALVRTTIGLLNYTSIGLAPAMIRLMAIEKRDITANQPSEVFSSAAALTALTAIVGMALAFLYAWFFRSIHVIPPEMATADLRIFVALMGLGMVFRIVSDPAGAVLQVRGRIALDNVLLAAAEWVWIGLVAVEAGKGSLSLTHVAGCWVISAFWLAYMRARLSQKTMGRRALSWSAVRLKAFKSLLSFGLLVAIAQAADFLYAPTDNILINRFINPVTVAVYAPAIQIDAGLLLLVSGIAATLLPHSALAHAGGDSLAVRRYYISGTLLSIALLLPAAGGVLLISPWLFHLWLNDSLPATRAILPLVLIHTVVGGSSGVGRSILLAVGKVRPFTIAVLIAGTANVILSFVFMHYAGMGLRGIVLGTILAVVGRCAIWMPWYVLKTLRVQGKPML